MKSITPSYPDADRESVFEDGLKYQDFIVDLLLKELGIAVSNYASKYYQHNYGESRQGIEIKLDARISDTGNVSIEVAEKSRASNELWIPSGIMRADNTWLYVQGNYKTVFIFGKKTMQQLYLARYADKVWTPKPTIRTFLLPVPEADKYSLKRFEL